MSLQRRLVALLSVAALLAATAVAAVGGAAETRIVALGVELTVPADWLPIAGGVPRGLAVESRDASAWMEAHDPGGMLVVDRRRSSALNDPAAGPVRVTGEARVQVAGWPATRRDFVGTDPAASGRGFEILLDPVATAPSLVLTCRGMASDWRRVVGICNRIVASVATATATARAPVAADPPQPITPAGWLSPKEAVAFAGRLEDGWSAYAAAGGDYAAFAGISDGVLVVDVPAGHGWAKTGIVSREPVIRLDEFGPGASSTTTFRFDPARTTGATIALSPAVVSEDSWGLGGAYVFWNRKPDGSGAVLHWWDHSGISSGEDHVETTATTLSELRVVLTPGKIGIVVPGGPSIERPFALALPGAGFFLHVHAAAAEGNLAAKMALAGIEVRRVASPTPEGDPQPAAGVAPLPTKRVFDGTLANWEPFGQDGGDFQAFARIGRDGLAIAAPEKRGWARTGIVSKEPLFRLDGMSPQAPHRLSFAFDPKRTDGVMIEISPSKITWFYRESAAWITVARIGPHRWRLGYAQGDRILQTRDAAGDWDGRLDVTMGDRRSSVAMPGGGPTIPHPSGWFSDGRSFWVSLMTRPLAADQKASLHLSSIDLVRLPPPGMSRALRWRLVEDADFRPDDLLEELVGAPAGARPEAVGSDRGETP